MKKFDRKQRKIFTIAWLPVFTCAIFGSWNHVAAQTTLVDNPALVVDKLHDALIEVATAGESLSYEQRLQQLQPVIDGSHDFFLIARLVGGRFWKNINDNERSKFTEAFRHASIAAYVSRFVSADGVRFDRAEVQDSLGNRVSVSSHLIRADETRVTFDYILHEVQDHWRIITIMVDGVSDLALQRAELSKIYDDAGLQAVIEHLESRTVTKSPGSQTTMA